MKDGHIYYRGPFAAQYVRSNWAPALTWFWIWRPNPEWLWFLIGPLGLALKIRRKD